MADKRSAENANSDEPQPKIAKSASSENATNEADEVVRARGFYSMRKGEREDMQDAHVLLDDFSAHVAFCSDIKRSAYYAIFDGHGGQRAAKFAAERLHTHLAEKIATGPDAQAVEQSLKRAHLDAYKKTDEQFLSEATKVKPSWKDGTTVTTVLILNNTLFVANLGDSRAVLCRFKTEESREIALVLTKDHSPQVFEERMRIQKAGGNVKDGRILGMLEVSRSIGDGPFKAHGVSCVPDIKKCSLLPNDRYVLIACDGLWKAFSNQEALQFIADSLVAAKVETKGASIADPNETRSAEQILWDNVCGRLAAEAVRRGCGDNVTVVIVVLKTFWQ
uniref:PPM-type phosphatase domain-containing protein n=1 Tax=Plectus sambesii TaxID=2011161 RepID=A0A914X4M2_9BILA